MQIFRTIYAYRRANQWLRHLSLRDFLKLRLTLDRSSIHIYPRPWNHAVLIRRDTVDIGSLWCALIEQYHRPPVALGSAPVILDLGSNIGLTMLDLKTEYPDARIIGVEMDHENYLMAQENTRNLLNVDVINAAVSISNGVVKYCKAANADAFRIQEDGKGACLVEISALTIGDIMKQYNLHHIDYLKMDIEGTETALFSHDISWLAVVQSLNIEVHNGGLEQFISKLADNGFEAWKDTHHWSSVLAVRRGGKFRKV